MPNVVLNNGKSFACTENQSLLDAAMAQGVILEYSCRNGRCGSCKAPVINGQTALVRPELSLTAGEAASGLILTCCRTAVTDVALDLADISRLADINIRTMPARIAVLERLADDVIQIQLRLPPKSEFRYLPGQFIDIIAAGVRRSYSIANVRPEGGMIELHVRRVVAGALSKFWFEDAKINDLIRFEGPFGTFFLKDNLPKHLVLLATGTGLAPVKALMEELALEPGLVAGHKVSVYWGGRRPEDFYWSPPDFPYEFSFNRVISRPVAGDAMRYGYVQDVLAVDLTDFSDVVVYACGGEAMIDSARALLANRGLPRTRFYFDAFVASGD